jgi:predicted PurR-regulated permease PerM
MSNNNPIKISNAFQAGLLGGLGVLTAVLIGNALAAIATIITYVAAAIFITLGLDPVVAFLEKRKVPRGVGILIVVVGILGLFGGLIALLVPTVISEGTLLFSNAPAIFNNFLAIPWVNNLDVQVNGSISHSLDGFANFIKDSNNWPTMLGGVVQVSVAVFNGFFAALTILILSLYFMASLSAFKRFTYSLVPASKRESFKIFTETIADSIGRYVIGQVSIAALNAVLGFAVMSIFNVPYAVVLAVLSFLLVLVPMIGSMVNSAVIILVALMVSPTTALMVGIYYLIYMQVEAYFVTPRVMLKAVKVPAAAVMVGALAGGTLLGLLGALVSIPATAALSMVIKQVWVKRQNNL